MSQACVAYTCVLNQVPNSSFCTPVASRGQTDRTHEDELLDLLQQTRVAGGATCGTSGATAVAPLRLDARLTCAARAFASDLANTHSTSLTDSQGRDTQARMALAGYQSTAWADSFALDSASAADALTVMLAGASSCPQLVSADYLDVGIGVAGNTYVVTLGSQ